MKLIQQNARAALEAFIILPTTEKYASRIGLLGTMAGLKKKLKPQNMTQITLPKATI